ncbi:GNAT family N-acetyltransferase [Mycoplasmopsis citelli]|uniref:GNAT family N-acetyltransferase n=1 Tax=Mycoplasmopsis citelli TaxID=171281 RepID=UPI00211525D5|nr:GNAT family N-acetyltransferase [Mycoplasmopsis citelli]UUD36328.1 GNAT family N-acetyltransferase [Mycoplasmopsis citelli]
MRKFILAQKIQKDQILDFLYQNEPFLNTFLISDIENFGLFADNDVFTYVNEGPLQDVILYFFGNLVIYLKDEHFDEHSFIEIVKNHNVLNILLVGIKSQKLLNLLQKFGFNYSLYQETFMKLNKQKFKQIYSQANLKSKKIKLEDIPLIINASKQIAEFEGLGEKLNDPKYLQSAFNSGSYFGYVIRNSHQILAHAASSAVTKQAVMIGRVFTNINERQKGYAFDCLLNLCNNILNSNKTPILFWNNIHAGKLYEKIGFEVIGDFVVLVKNH